MFLSGVGSGLGLGLRLGLVLGLGFALGIRVVVCLCVCETFKCIRFPCVCVRAIICVKIFFLCACVRVSQHKYVV